MDVFQNCAPQHSLQVLELGICSATNRGEEMRFNLFYFLAMLGLCCCTWTFSSCRKLGLLFIAVASFVAEHSSFSPRAQKQPTGLVALKHMESSQTRDQTHVPCIGRYILFFFNRRLITLLWWFLPSSNMISHGCTRIPHPASLPPPLSRPHPTGLSQSTSFDCTASCMKLALVIYFIYGNIHVSMLLSQNIPPSPSLTESKILFFTRESLLLSCI